MVQGRVTGVSDGAVVGWIAADAADQELEASAVGEGVFGRARAQPGEDGRLAFAVAIPERLRDGRIRFIEVRAVGVRTPLEGGPVIFDGDLFDTAPSGGDVTAGRLSVEDAALPPPLTVEGAVDRPAGSIVTGWAFAPDEPGRRLKVEILARGRLVATAVADLEREGAGDGRCGFLVDLSRVLRRGPHPIAVRVAGHAEPLPGGRFSVGPFPADGEVDLPGYLDQEDDRRLLSRSPFEHLAFDAARLAPSRITPRLINRLRRERMAFEDHAGGLVTLATLPGEVGDLARLWSLQSYPVTKSVAAGPGMRAAGESDFVLFGSPDDVIHPSAAGLLAGLRDADVVTWPRFCADEPRAGSPGWVLRRPEVDPLTARHGALTDTTLAVRGAVLAQAPEAVLFALEAGRLHPLWFWLAGQTLAWRTHPEALTSCVGGLPPLRRADVEADEAFYRERLAEEDAGFSLERTEGDLPFPYVLAPTRRARRISVLISFRNGAGMTLRALQSIARQRLSGELEIVLVDNRSEPAEARAVADGARRMFGDTAVKFLAYAHPFNHSAQNNLAARAARSDAIVICNNDVVLKDPGALEQMCAFALVDGIGSVGCRLEDPERAIGSYGHVFAPPSPDPYRPPLQENPDPTYAGFVHAVPGNTLALAAMARDRFLELGGLDEVRFPIGYNDMDLMLRASAAGLTHLYLGHVTAEHPRGASRTGDNEDQQALLANARRPPEAHLRQLARERIDHARPRAPKPVAPALGPAEEAELKAALEGAIEARRTVERERLTIAAMLAAPVNGKGGAKS